MTRLTFFVSSLAVGGAERHTIDLRARLSRRGFSTDLLVYGAGRSGTLLDLEGAEGAVELNIRGLPGLSDWRRIWRTIKGRKADVILAVNQTTLIIAVVARILGATNAKIACIFHSTVLQERQERQLPLFRLAIAFADALVYICDSQRKHWEKRSLWCHRTPVILNGIDLSRFRFDAAQRASIREQLGLTDDDVVFGMVAAFRPEKNHAQLVEAISELRARGLPAKALFVGDGPTRPAVERLAQERGVSNHILFAGEKADVRPCMVASDAGVLCSPRAETFSLAALEFLASGVPMVMSDVGGSPEIVRHGVNGYLFKAGDTAGFVDRLSLLAHGPTRATLAANARPSVEHLSIESMVAQYANFVSELHGSERRSWRWRAPMSRRRLGF
jgi:glycosyltransferase involved in cell wall biosynthesis